MRCCRRQPKLQDDCGNKKCSLFSMAPAAFALQCSPLQDTETASWPRRPCRGKPWRASHASDLQAFPAPNCSQPKVLATGKSSFLSACGGQHLATACSGKRLGAGCCSPLHWPLFPCSPSYVAAALLYQSSALCTYAGWCSLSSATLAIVPGQLPVPQLPAVA
jgi:hypothetical protein